MKCSDRDAERRLQNEIEHGKYLASTKSAGEIWGWESPAGKLRWARRVKMLSSHIEPDMRILEIGCGTGYFTKELLKQGAHITAIDISAELLDIAKSKISAPNVQFLLENACNLKFSDCSFDSVVGSSVLHHLDYKRALGECFRVIKNGGTLCFTEPNMLNPQIALQKNIAFIKRVMGDSPNETALLRWKVKHMLERYGFRDIEIKPFDFLHPKTPTTIKEFMERATYFMEKIPLLREIAGSLFIRAEK